MTAARFFLMLIAVAGWGLLFTGLGYDEPSWDMLKIAFGLTLLIAVGVAIMTEGNKK